MTTRQVNWRDETTGVMASIVRKHLIGVELDAVEAQAFRRYIRQWVENGVYSKKNATREALSRLQWARTNVEFGLVIDLLAQDGIVPL